MKFSTKIVKITTATFLFIISFVVIAAESGYKAGDISKVISEKKENVMAVVNSHVAIEEEKLSNEYTLNAEGKDVPVYTAMVDTHAGEWDPTYSFAYFDFEGNIEIEIHSSIPLTEVSIRPVSEGITAKISGNKATFKLNKPGNYVIERNGNGRKDLLLLFANPLETYKPDKTDPNVIYFERGKHTPGEIKISSNQTLYIESGAVVDGYIKASGDNIRILGRGILMSRGKDKHTFYPSLLVLNKCKNVEVEGIILRKESRSWTVIPRGCDNVTISNIKICNSYTGNDDGFDPVNTRNLIIQDCFVRTKDDCFALKGLKNEDGDCENITVRRCTFWSDECCAILLGDECRAAHMRNILFEDCNVMYLSYEKYPKKLLMLHCSDGMIMENIRLENFSVYGEGQKTNYIEITSELNKYSEKKYAGYIKNVILKDINLEGMDGPYNILLSGKSYEYSIDGLVFDNCTINGKKITEDYPNLQTNEFVKNLNFK